MIVFRSLIESARNTLSRLGHEPFEFSRQQARQIMDPVYERGDRLMSRFIGIHCVIALAQGYFYEWPT